MAKKKSYSKTEAGKENVKILYGKRLKELDKQIEAFPKKILSLTYFVHEDYYMAVIKY